MIRLNRLVEYQRRHIQPTALRPAPEAELSQLHTLGTFEQVEAPRCVRHHMANEFLPLELESVLVHLVVGHLFPLLLELHGLWLVGIPDRTRRVHAVLRITVCQTCYG